MKWKQTCKVIVEGTQTLSKLPSAHVEGVYPKYIVKGKGCHVWDETGNKYIDFPCALGANILGYGNEQVAQAVRTVLDNGTLFSLSSPIETELAELIHTLIPSMEMMRFVKTGSESCSAAVKIARAFTGRKPIVSSGYHGWHDWNNQPDVTSIMWGDLKRLEKVILKEFPAAFIIEPYIYADEKMVERYLHEAYSLCKHYGVLMIFDENKTGFRTKKLTASNYWGVRPDLTCLGKAMANGVPMACVGGRRDVMDVLKGDCLVSSTFGGDLIGISAAIATINQLIQSGVIEHIWDMGDKIKTAFNQAAKEFGLEGTRCIGLPPRTQFVFPTEAHLGLFWQECLDKGVLFGHAQFTCFAHKQLEVDFACAAIRHAIGIVKNHWDNPMGVVRGIAPQERRYS